MGKFWRFDYVCEMNREKMFVNLMNHDIDIMTIEGLDWENMKGKDICKVIKDLERRSEDIRNRGLSDKDIHIYLNNSLYERKDL